MYINRGTSAAPDFVLEVEDNQAGIDPKWANQQLFVQDYNLYDSFLFLLLRMKPYLTLMLAAWLVGRTVMAHRVSCLRVASTC